MKCQIFLFCLVLFLSLVKQFISLPFSFSFIIVSLFASLVSSPHFIYLYMFSFSIIFFPFNLSKYFIHTTSTWRTTKWCSQNHSYSLFFSHFWKENDLQLFFLLTGPSLLPLSSGYLISLALFLFVYTRALETRCHKKLKSMSVCCIWSNHRHLQSIMNEKCVL